jgi:hypothetical protein
LAGKEEQQLPRLRVSARCERPHLLASREHPRATEAHDMNQWASG